MGSGEKIYTLYLLPGTKRFLFGLLGVLTLAGLWMLGAWLGGAFDALPVLALLAWLAMLGFSWYRILSLPHRIEVACTGTIAFLSLLGRVEVLASEIESIQPELGQFGFVLVRHRGGKIRLLMHFDGFHEFLAELKAANPAVVLRGC